MHSKDALFFYNTNKTKMETNPERIDNANLSQSKDTSQHTEHPKHGEGPKMPPGNSATRFSGYMLLQEEFSIILLQCKNHIISASQPEMPHLKQVIWQQWEG